MSPAITPLNGDSSCARILCVGDDVVDLLDIPLTLGSDHDFVIVASVQEGDGALTTEAPFDLIISGSQFQNATDFFDRLHAHSPDAERIILTAPGDRRALEVASRDARVMRVLLRPCPESTLREAVYDALLRHRARVLRAQYAEVFSSYATPGSQPSLES